MTDADNNSRETLRELIQIQEDMLQQNKDLHRKIDNICRSHDRLYRLNIILRQKSEELEKENESMIAYLEKHLGKQQ